MPQRSSDFRKYASITTVVLLVGLFSFWHSQPYVPTQARSFFGGGDISYLYWLFAWQLDRLAALDFVGLVNAPVFYPLPLASACSSQILSTSFLALPFSLATGATYRLYNYFVFVSYPLSFAGAYLWIRLGRFQRLSCLAGAAVFAFSAYRLQTGGYLSHISMQWIPFSFYFLTCWLTTAKGRDGWLFALFFLLHVGASEHNFVMGNLFFPLYAALFILRRRRLGQPLPSLLQAAGPLVLAGLGTAALYAPSYFVAVQTGATRSLSITLDYAADLEQYIGAKHTFLFTPLLQRFTGKGNVLWPTLAALVLLFFGATHLLRQTSHANKDWQLCAFWATATGLAIIAACCVKFMPDLDLWQGLYFLQSRTVGIWHLGLCMLVGLVILVLMTRLFLLLPGVPEPAFFPAVAGYLAVLAMLVSFGPLVRVHGVLIAANPVAYLFYGLVPGGDAVRALTRSFHFFSLFAGAVCAMALDRMEQARPVWRVQPRFLLLGLLLLELVPAWPLDFSLRSEPAQLPPEYAWLASQSESGPVLEVPFGEDSDYMERALVHRKPLVNGFGSFFWRGYATLRHVVERQGLADSQEEGCPPSECDIFSCMGRGQGIRHCDWEGSGLRRPSRRWPVMWTMHQRCACLMRTLRALSAPTSTDWTPGDFQWCCA